MAKPLVTRGNFVSAYINGSGIPAAERTRGGFRLGPLEFKAGRCACDYEGCLGWQMHRPTLAEQPDLP